MHINFNEYIAKVIKFKFRVTLAEIYIILIILPQYKSFYRFKTAYSSYYYARYKSHNAEGEV